MQGIIIRWDDERGFGFVKEKITKTEIFVHISAFNFTNPRPEVGDKIEFDTSYNEEKERTEITTAMHLIKKPALSLVKNRENIIIKVGIHLIKKATNIIRQKINDTEIIIIKNLLIMQNYGGLLHSLLFWF